MKKRIKLLFSLMVILMPCITYSQVVNLIPSEHLGYDVAGVLNSWKNSGTHAFDEPLYVDKQIDVTESGYNIFSNGVACGDEINKLITELNPPPSINNMVMLYFPAGGYIIDKPIVLPGHVILKGAGGDFELPQQTHFHFNLGTDYAHPCISISGEMNGVEDIYIVDDTPYTPSIQVTSTPTSFINGALYYGVTGATAMYTNVAGTCSGSGTVTNNQGIFYCAASLKPGISYLVTTTFSNSLESISVTHTAWFSGDKIQIENNDIPPDNIIGIQNNSDTSKNKTPDSYYQYTININGDSNWIRGVESGNTRRFHVFIGNGLNNTISGCYFHHAVDYSDNGGRGYGVCLSGTAKFNRIEDNIFEHLRHSMVLQGDAERNVFGYNYSFDIHATGGNPFYPEADLLLHGRPGKPGSYEHGPKTNLLEGNYVERIRVDKQHEEKNGPFNTYFRCYSSTWFKISPVKENFQKGQYKQNVIGSRMDPKGNTKSRIEQEGYTEYWVDYPNYINIPDIYASYYYDSKPDFYFQTLPWPLKPWVFQPPATVRCNMGLTRPVYAGWGSYNNLCGPPNYKFYGVLWQNANEEYRAMDKIEVSLSYVIQNTYLNLHAGNSVFLKPGFKVMEGNNHVIIKVGNVCEAKQNSTSKNSIYDNISYVGLFDENGQKDTLTKSFETDMFTGSNQNKEQTENGFLIFPNPNNGEFFIRTNCTLDKRDIRIYGLMGNELQFKLFKYPDSSKIILINNYCGVLFLKIQTNGINKMQKLLIK